MKILAIEKELKTVDWENESETLIEEAKTAYKMMLSGHLGEIYFNENKIAVLVLECEDKKTARQLLEKGMFKGHHLQSSSDIVYTFQSCNLSLNEQA